MRDAVKKSYGFNVAYPFFDNAKDVKNTENKKYERNFSDLWNFDIFLLNIDRTIQNTNINELRAKLKHLNLSKLIGFLPPDWVSSTKNLARILEQGIRKAIDNSNFNSSCLIDSVSIYNIVIQKRNIKN